MDSASDAQKPVRIFKVKRKPLIADGQCIAEILKSYPQVANRLSTGFSHNNDWIIWLCGVSFESPGFSMAWQSRPVGIYCEQPAKKHHEKLLMGRIAQVVFGLYGLHGSSQTSPAFHAIQCERFSHHSVICIMDIQIATLCDFAADYNGKLVITGTFDTLAARALPVVHPACALAMRFCFTPEDAGRHQLSITIINEDGEALDPNNMPIKPEFEVQVPKNTPFLTRNVVMNLQGLRFPAAGIYSIDIGCDGEILVRLPLRIVHVTQGPNGETQMS